MPVSVSDFNDLVTRVDDLEARIEVIEDMLDVTVSGSIQKRISDLEAHAATINQVHGAKAALEDQILSEEARITAVENEQLALRALVNALQAHRIDLRHELVYEEATDAGGGTTWTLSEIYDETSAFVVFQSALTLVDPGVITYSDPDNKEFTSSVVLTGPVFVMYFKGFAEE